MGHDLEEATMDAPGIRGRTLFPSRRQQPKLVQDLDAVAIPWLEDWDAETRLQQAIDMAYNAEIIEHERHNDRGESYTVQTVPVLHMVMLLQALEAARAA